MTPGNEINVDIKVNNEELEETKEILEEISDLMPNITIKENENVYLTINFFREEDK